mmetsp:Transcript_16995/g.14926  ORF Transcript_16995/g.14926 Transcript_16995/m.14926 type:complete len:128 (+) Transcript_16995:139-522(+)
MDMKANNITSVEFQKNLKPKASSKDDTPSSKLSKSKSRIEKVSSSSSSKSTSNILNDENSNLQKSPKEEIKLNTRNKPINRLTDKSNIHTKDLPVPGSLKSETEKSDKKKHKSFYESPVYAERTKSK